MNASRRKVLLAAPLLGAMGILSFAGPAAAQDGVTGTDLLAVPLNGVAGEGVALIEITGTTLSFAIAADGLLAGSAHAVHIHYGDDVPGLCPPATANTNPDAATDPEGPNDDAYINVAEGLPFYGGILRSLTTEGPSGPADALALDRFEDGATFEYERTDLEVTEAESQQILSGKAVIVVHGVDVNNSGGYDLAGAGPSELDPSGQTPSEATLPALCGELAEAVVVVPPAPTPTPTPTPTATPAPTVAPAPAATARPAQVRVVPRGGVATGEGTTSGTENLGLIAGGLLAVAAGAVVLGRRRLGSVES